MPVHLPAWLHWSAAPADASPLQRRNFINVQIDGIGVGLANASAPFIPVFLAHLGATNFQVGLLTAMPAVAGLLLSLAIGQFLQRQRNVVPWYGRARFLAILAYAATGLVTLVVPPAWAVNVTLLIWAVVTVPQIMTNVGFSVVMNGVAGPQGRYELMSRRWSADYVKRWVAAFESKDLDRVLAFYTDDVIFHSPLIARLSHDPSGTVQGKAALRAYVRKGFEVFDHIKFTVLDVLRDVDSIAIHYQGITGTHVVEVLFFDKDGMVRESFVHYSSPE